MITPPAKVALRISYILNFPLLKCETRNPPKQLAVNDMTVLLIMIDFYSGEVAKAPALKDGQNIQRNRQPIIEKVLFI
jgi:hypothetical protein